MSSQIARALIALFVILLLSTPTWMMSAPAIDVHFVDITDQAGIKFKHVSSPEKKYIVESMSGGVALFDYDNDGYPDIYLVNSLTVDMVKSKQKTRSVLYHNNGDGAFTDVTDRAGVGDIGPVRHIGKRSVTVVVIENAARFLL